MYTELPWEFGMDEKEENKYFRTTHFHLFNGCLLSTLCQKCYGIEGGNRTGCRLKEYPNYLSNKLESDILLCLLGYDHRPTDNCPLYYLGLRHMITG